jgi:hypothetical protein
LFYYAVESFADGEIVDIVDAAFRRVARPAVAGARRSASQEALGRIDATLADGHRVCLLVAPGLLRQSDPFVGLLTQRLVQCQAMVTVDATEGLSPAYVGTVAGRCDRLVALSARDLGLWPGALARSGVPAGLTGEPAARSRMLCVQPDAMGGLAGIDCRTTAALAEHVVSELVGH